MKNPQEKEDNARLFYALGYRDALASVLAEYKDKIKLLDLAVLYMKSYDERHFSHEYHTAAPWCAFHAIVRLLIATGQRRGEIARLEWKWIDEAERTITFPSHITKNKRTHTIPYGDTTADLFRKVPKMIECPYLFPAARTRSEKTTVFNAWSKSKAALDRQLYVNHQNGLCKPLEPWTLHDLRRTAASSLQMLGVRLEVTERLLNHVSGTQSGIVGVYQRHHFMPEMRQSVLCYEDFLTTLTASED